VSDKKITELNNITSANLSDVDEFVVVDISGDETKAITYGELKQFNGAISSDGLTVNGDITATGGDLNLDTLDLNAIAATKAVTAVDVFVYDTSKDSDGGAWRKRTQGTSWYNETLNTATRGSRKEFPAVAVIVAEADKVTIYDGDDPSLPMWMVISGGGDKFFNTAGSGAVTAVSMRNGWIVGTSSTRGYSRLNFISEEAYIGIGQATYKVTAPIAVFRNATVFPTYTVTGSLFSIVNAVVRDVSMTVLPDAPIDPATGLPVPTIAVATAGGVSVIKDDGTVVNITGSLSGSEASDHAVLFDDVNRLWLVDRGFVDYGFYLVGFNLVPSADTTVSSADFKYSTTSSTAVFGNIRTLGVTSNLAISASASSSGLTKYSHGIDADDGMVAYTTSTYNTGWMNGDIKGAFLSDTDDTDLVGGTDNDRSFNANPLTVNGTVTRTPVATGADLVAYSGFSASNYLEQPYNSDLDFGAGDFCVMGWVKGWNPAFSQYTVLSRLGTNAITFGKDSASNKMAVIQSGRMNEINSISQLNQSSWSHIAFVRSGSLMHFYINGAFDNSASMPSWNFDLADGVVQVGTYAGSQNNGGSLALLRIGATAPTAEQIAKIYNDEKVLFQEGAQATLYGTSDAVTALAHDSDTNLLHVGTSDGRSVFQGLRRVSNTTTAVGTAISASNGLVVEE